MEPKSTPQKSIAPPMTITTQVYQEALENIEPILGKLRTSTQARTVEKITKSDRKDLEAQKKKNLEIIAQGPTDTYEQSGLLTKKYKGKSLADREVRDFLLNKTYQSMITCEKMLQTHENTLQIIKEEYSQLNLPFPINSPICDNLVKLRQQYDKYKNKINAFEDSIAQNKQELITIDEKINSKILILNKLDKAMNAHEKGLQSCENEHNSIMDEYNKLNLSLPIESIDLDKPENLSEQLINLKKRHDNNQRKKNIIEGHMKQAKKQSSTLNVEIKISQGVRNTLLSNINTLVDHLKPRIEKYNHKLNDIRKEYAKLEIPLPIEFTVFESIPDLKNAYDANQEKRQKTKQRLKGIEEQFSTLKADIARSNFAIKELQDMLTPKKSLPQQNHYNW